MITPLIFGVLLLIFAGAIWYMFADLGNRMYGNIISGIFATLLSGLFALWLFQGNVQEITAAGAVPVADGGLGWFFMLLFVSLLIITGILISDAWLEHIHPRGDAEYGPEE